ncbi:flavin-dependent oxidoreductase [Primorskyibacter sp. S187A]|uniref:flavin-dependent oxidoreductase n=1 Tax=Primorskyibacter sp. S187A TaxID=3415130 RepID=UPI003C7B033E
MGQDHQTVLIAGGGIGGLALALTLHQIGLSCVVLEGARAMKPLGVGINLQPNAVRELDELGLGPDRLASVGVAIREWALVGLNGKEVYAEPRGLEAGYLWPQIAVHRGQFHMLLYREVLDRMGPGAVRCDARVMGYEQTQAGVVVRVQSHSGQKEEVAGVVLIGADGIHSKVRAQMHPNQPPIHWGGALMYRGTLRAKPLRGGASFVGLGTHAQRMVLYPISAPDGRGIAEINWIAERTVPSPGHWPDETWFRPVGIEEVIPHFEAFCYDWLNVPEMLRRADVAYANPMIDREPVETWVQGRVALLGDAAHAMYPTGSNGASQAIVDGRVLGAAFVRHGVSPEALRAYDAELCEPISQLVLRNRGAGPFGLLNLLDERCGGVFDAIDDVLPAEVRAAHMDAYKRAAGLERETLNTAVRRIPDGARVT